MVSSLNGFRDEEERKRGSGRSLAFWENSLGNMSQLPKE